MVVFGGRLHQLIHLSGTFSPLQPQLFGMDINRIYIFNLAIPLMSFDPVS